MSLPVYYPSQRYTQPTTQQYGGSSEYNSDWREPRPEFIEIIIRQQPREGLVTSDGKEKARKPIDPPPIVEMKVANSQDPHQHFLQSPYFFMTCDLVEASHQRLPVKGALVGMLTSSLHRLKDINNRDGGFFVFGDLSAKKVGRYVLHFSLFDLRGLKDSNNPRAVFLKECWSEDFKVSSPKEFKGMDESTYLSRAFSDQGVRLRLRKEPRAAFNKKRSLDYEDSRAVQPAGVGAAPEEEVTIEDHQVKRSRYEDVDLSHFGSMYTQSPYGYNQNW